MTGPDVTASTPGPGKSGLRARSQGVVDRADVRSKMQAPQPVVRTAWSTAWIVGLTDTDRQSAMQILQPQRADCRSRNTDRSVPQCGPSGQLCGPLGPQVRTTGPMCGPSGPMVRTVDPTMWTIRLMLWTVQSYGADCQVRTADRWVRNADCQSHNADRPIPSYGLGSPQCGPLDRGTDTLVFALLPAPSQTISRRRAGVLACSRRASRPAVGTEANVNVE